MIISEKQLMQLIQILQMKLNEFEANFEYRNSLYKQILLQQSEELREIKND
jgi:hypothetical protein